MSEANNDEQPVKSQGQPSQTQNNQTMPNESNLLQSQVVNVAKVDASQNSSKTQQTPTTTPQDDRPISSSARPVNSFDQRPIGGGKKTQMSEYPEGQNPPPAISANSFDQKPIGGGKKIQMSEYPEGSKNPPSANSFDEKPIGGGKKAPQMSEYPQGQRPVNAFDQQPIGGGKKPQMSEFPEQGDAPTSKKAPVKKPVQARKPFSKPTAVSSKPKQEQIPVSGKPQVLDQIPIGSNNNASGGTSGFDQKPIGKSTFQLSQFPEGEQPPEQKEYPMLQKLKSKAAKLRLSGMEDLLKILEETPDDPDLAEVDPKALAKETAPANLQKGLLCLKLWLERDRSYSQDELKNAIQNGMAKPNTRPIVLSICQLAYEKSASTLETAILLGLKSKLAKLIAYYMTVINEMLAIFGIKRMKYLKPYIPEVVRLLNDKKDMPIKNQGEKLLKQAYKWLGRDVVAPMLGDLKEALRKQLDSFWEGYDKDQVMTAPKGEQAAQVGGGKKKVDAYDLSQPVDVFKKYNEKWSDSVINAPKWSQKTKMLQEFVKAASVPKLANTQFRHISQMVRRLINDSNFNVVLWILKVLATMARGLRRYFYAVARNNFSNVMWKFRDKKTQMVDQTFNTLNDLSHSISIEEVLQDVKEGLQDKAPNMKCNLINWIGKFVETKAQASDSGQVPDKILDALKALFNVFEKLLSDGTAQVRDCMAKNVFKMKMQVGDDFFDPIENKMSKTLASKAESKIKKDTGGKAKTATKNKEQTSSKSASNSMKKDTSSSNVKKDTGNNNSATSKIESKKQVPELKLERFQEPTLQDASQNLVAAGLSPDQLKHVSSNGAKQRTALFTQLRQLDLGPGNMLSACVLIRALYKDWKQANLIMNKDLISFLQEVAEGLEKPELSVLLGYYVEKISETKFAEGLASWLEKLCARIPAPFIVAHLLDKAAEGKRPKANVDLCGVLGKILGMVSAVNLPVREVAKFAESCYKIPLTRKGGVDLLKLLYCHIGENQLKQHIEAATCTAMQAEFKGLKLFSQTQRRPGIQLLWVQMPSRPVGGITNSSTVSRTSNQPRVDITQQVLPLLTKMNDAGNWQNRKDAAQAMINLITDNQDGLGRVTISCMSDLMNILRTRTNDPNKQLIRLFVNLVGLLFPSLSDKDLKLYAKPFTAAVCDVLSDKMQSNKKEAIATLNRIGERIGHQHLMFTLAPYLQGDKQSRTQIINLMLCHEQHLSRTDTRDFPKGITNCLCDKNREIRSLGEKLLEKVHSKIGLQPFRSIAQNQRPAIMKDLNAIYDKYDSGKGGQHSHNNSKANSPASKDNMGSTLNLNKSGIRHPNSSSQNAPPTSAKKRSLSKSSIKPVSKSYIEVPVASEETENSRASTIHHNAQTMVEGDDYFAPLANLTALRVERQEEAAQWARDQINEQQQEKLKQEVSLLLRKDLAQKMLSFDQKRVSQAVLLLIRLCKDATYQPHFRQLYDLLLRWALLRLWGGSPALLSTIEIFPPIFSVLQKRKLALNDAQVDLAIALIREYFISCFMHEFKVSDSLHVVVRSLIALSSGERVTRKVLRQFSLQLTSIHRHLKKDVNVFYRDGLSSLVRMHCMDYIGSEQLLEQVSRIKELRTDQEFVHMLYNKFHQTVLNNFGFRDTIGANGMNQTHQPPNQNQNHNTLNLSSTQAPPLPTRQHLGGGTSVSSSGLPRRERSVSSDSRLSKGRTPNMDHNRQQPQQQQDYDNSQQQQPTNSAPTFQNWSQQIQLQSYPSPHPISPLGKHLSKLVGASQQTVTFFTQLFSQSGQKIANELVLHAKIILGSILKSVMQMLEQRHQHAPERIVAQINLLQNCLRCRHVILHADELLILVTRFTLRQLVYQDENKAMIHQDLRQRGIDYKIENFIKVINGVMLRILQNANPQQVVNTLLTIHNQLIQGPQRSSTKTTYLIMKCTSRVAGSYTADMRPDLVVPFFEAVCEYFTLEPPPCQLQDFQLPAKDKPKPQENYINSIKTILLQLARILNQDIWELYHRAMEQSKYQDGYIGQYLTSVGVVYVERQPTQSQSSYHHQRNNSANRAPSASKQNQDLRKISQLLSKNKTFDSGILQLKKFTKSNASFSPADYFSSLGYDQKFIAMVMNSLQGKQRRTPRKDISRQDKSKSPIGSQNAHIQQQDNIQDKIKKLKQKFEQLQPGQNQGQSQSSGNQSSTSQSHLVSNSQQTRNTSNSSSSIQTGNPKEERTVQIKRRIDEMKNRLNNNMSTNDNKPSR